MKYNFTDALIEAYEPLCEETAVVDLQVKYPYITFSGDTKIAVSNEPDTELLDTTIKEFTLTPEQENRIKAKLANLNLEVGSESYTTAWNKEIAKDKEIAKSKAEYDAHAAIVRKWMLRKNKLTEGLYINSINLTAMTEKLMRDKIIIDATTKLLIEEFFLYKIGTNSLHSTKSSAIGLNRLAVFLNAEISEVAVLSCLAGYDTQRAAGNKDWELTRASLPPADGNGFSADILVKGGLLSKNSVTVEVKVSKNTQTVGKSLWKAHKAEVVAAYLEDEHNWVTFVKLSKTNDSTTDKKNNKETVETNLPSYYTTSTDIADVVDTAELINFKNTVRFAKELQIILNDSYKDLKLTHVSNINRQTNDPDYGSVTLFCN